MVVWRSVGGMPDPEFERNDAKGYKVVTAPPAGELVGMLLHPRFFGAWAHFDKSSLPHRDELCEGLKCPFRVKDVHPAPRWFAHIGIQLPGMRRPRMLKITQGCLNYGDQVLQWHLDGDLAGRYVKVFRLTKSNTGPQRIRPHERGHVKLDVPIEMAFDLERAVQKLYGVEPDPGLPGFGLPPEHNI